MSDSTVSRGDTRDRLERWDRIECRSEEPAGQRARQLLVNGLRLDLALADAVDPTLEGLLPAWLDWYDVYWPQGAAERRWVQERSLPSGPPCVLPILLCPDDFTFDCTTVVVEVSASASGVLWSRFGIDDTPFDPDAELPYIGGVVTWYEASPSFEFRRSDYVACLQGFGMDPETSLGS